VASKLVSSINVRGIIKLFAFLVIGLGVGLLGGFLIVRQMNQPESELDVTPSVAPDAPMVEVAVMLQTVPAGWEITENEITIDFRLASEVPDTAVVFSRYSFPNFDSELNQFVDSSQPPVINTGDILGHKARFDLFQGQTLTTLMIGPPAYEALMATRPISRGMPITPDQVRFVSVPYDSLRLHSDTIIYEERLWSINMTAKYPVIENQLLSWSAVTSTETLEPIDPYIATKGERDKRKVETRLEAPVVLSPEQSQQIERFAILDYPVAFFLGVLVTIFVRRWRRQKGEDK